MSGESPDWSAPYFVQPFQGVRTRQGNDVSFAAVVFGEPTPHVSWCYRGGSRLPHSEKHYQYYNPETGEVSLTIRQLGPGDEGGYSCTATNPYGEVTATLKIDPEGGGGGRGTGGGQQGGSRVLLAPDSTRMAMVLQQHNSCST